MFTNFSRHSKNVFITMYCIITVKMNIDYYKLYVLNIIPVDLFFIFVEVWRKFSKKFKKKLFLYLVWINWKKT